MGERRRPAGWGTVMLGSVIVLAGLVGTAAALSPPTPAPSPRPVEDACADADGDGLLTVTDGVQALRAVAGLPATCTPFRCDVDGDDAITVTDGILILSRAVGINWIHSYDCPVPSRVRDVSGFATFRMTLAPAFGFCPAPGSVVEADITPEPQGGYRVRLAVAEERPFDDPACIEPFVFGPTCVVAVPAVDRLLSDDEIEMLRSVFSAVTVYEERDPSCAIFAYDFCLDTTIQWDGLVASGEFCEAPWVFDFPVIEAVNRLLGSSEDVAR